MFRHLESTQNSQKFQLTFQFPRLGPVYTCPGKFSHGRILFLEGLFTWIHGSVQILDKSQHFNGFFYISVVIGYPLFYKPIMLQQMQYLANQTWRRTKTLIRGLKKKLILLLHVVMDFKAGKARDDYRKQYPFAATCTAKAQLIRRK